MNKARGVLASLRASLTSKQQKHDHFDLFHIMYVQVAAARAIDHFDVVYTPAEGDPAHADLTMNAALVPELALASGSAPKAIIEPFRRLAEVFVACEPADISALEALRMPPAP